MKFPKVILIILCAFLFSFGVTHAQITPEDALKNITQDVSIKINPENPGPGVDVNVFIESYSTNLDQAEITWSLNGKIIKSGVGQKTFFFKTGQAGSIITLKISIVPSSGKSFTKTITITPTTVDLMWQSLAYTPPFYKGRTLLPNQGSLKFLAIPKILDARGNQIDPKKMVYTWSKNGTVLGSLSGYSKNTLYVDNSLLNAPLTVSVSVTTAGSGDIATNSAYINPTEPKILFYEKNPLFGILYNRSIESNFNLLNKELTITASPFYYSTRDFPGGVNYNWYLNNGAVGSGNQNFITLRQDSGSGKSMVGIRVSNSNKLLQSSEKSVVIQFGDQNNL